MFKWNCGELFSCRVGAARGVGCVRVPLLEPHAARFTLRECAARGRRARAARPAPATSPLVRSTQSTPARRTHPQYTVFHSNVLCCAPIATVSCSALSLSLLILIRWCRCSPFSSPPFSSSLSLHTRRTQLKMYVLTCRAALLCCFESMLCFAFTVLCTVHTC